MARKFQFRRDTAAQWTLVNPVLAAGEPGFEIDTGFMKVGDGATAWTSLDYWRGGGAAAALGALAPAADKYAYYVDANTAALATITSYARNLLTKGDAGAARTLLEAAAAADHDALATLVTAIDTDLSALETAALTDDDVGTTANRIVALDGSGKLPAVDGSQLTGLPNAGAVKNKWTVHAALGNSTSSGRTLCTISNVQGQVGDVLVLPNFEPNAPHGGATLILSSAGGRTYISTNTQSNGVAPAYGYLRFYKDGALAGTIATVVKVGSDAVNASFGNLGLGNAFMYPLTDADAHTYEIRLDTYLASGRMSVGAGISGFFELFTPTAEIS